MWKNLLLIPVSLIVFFIFFEAAARIWFTLPKPYPTEPGLLVQDARGFWVIEPGFHGQYDNRVDYQGKQLSVTKFGTRRVPCMPKDEGAAKRLYLIGDSQTFGVGLADKETWANLVQCKLNDEPGVPWAVHNMGIPGTNIDQYQVRTISMLSNAIRPGDQVIVSATWNDLHTHISDAQMSGLLDDASRQQQSNGATAINGLSLELVMPLYRYGGKTWRYWLYQKTGVFIPSFNSPGEFISSVPYTSVLLGIVLPKARLLYYRYRDTGVLARKVGPETIRNNFKLLSSISSLVKRKGGRLIVNLLPNRLFFDDFYYWSYSQGKQGFPEQDYMMYLARPHCQQFGLECITSFPALKTTERDAYTFKFDGHYNEAGAAQIANFLFSYLTQTAPVE